MGRRKHEFKVKKIKGKELLYGIYDLKNDLYYTAEKEDCKKLARSLNGVKDGKKKIWL